MAYISIGQIENLEDAIAALRSTYQALESECNAKLQQVAAKVAEAQQEAENSSLILEEACQAELEKELSTAQAQAQLASAQEELSAACDALSVCEASGSYDDEGNYEPADCSAEESDVSAAEASLEQAEKAVETSADELEQAKDHRMQMEQRNDLARQCLSMAKQLEETVQSECTSRLSNISTLIETAATRLTQAKEALEAYIAENPEYGKFVEWLNWSPKSNVPVTPADLNSRLDLSPEQQRYFAEYLAERDPSFRAKIAGYRKELENANGQAERHAVQRKIRINMSGYFGEKIVEYGLKPLGEKISTQSRTTFDDGKYTKTDLIIEGLKVPVILGRGEGMGAPAGGSLAIEVKCGRADYLYSQKEHMIFQSGGHQDASASMTVCSRDIKDLTPEQEEELRAALREAGSPMIGMLPKKDEIDRTCWEAVLDVGVNQNKGGSNVN